MPKYVLSLSIDGELDLSLDESPFGDSDSVFQLGFTSANYFDNAVMLAIALTQTTPNKSLSDLSLALAFIDDNNNDKIYAFKGMMKTDINDHSSIVAVIDAHDDFSNVSLEIFSYRNDLFEDVLNENDLGAFNGYKSSSLGKRYEMLSVPFQSPVNVPELYKTIIRQDIQASVLYLQIGDNLADYTEMVRASRKLKVRLIVELPPTLTIDQAIVMAEDLMLDEYSVTFIWSPVIARPLDAVGIKGKKIPRWCGGTLLGHYMRREANKDTNGIPAIHRPIAGYDYPFNYVGIEQSPDIFFEDDDLKRMATAKINVVKREKFPNGIRFILEDSLTTYNDNRSILKLCNASDISMFIDKKLIEISKRHLQKHMDGYIKDALEECQLFLDNCTSVDRPLLRQSKKLGGYYTLSITPSNDRPDDQVILECAYHPQGTSRQELLKTAVSA